MITSDKNFDVWNELKKSLHNSNRESILFNDGDIWWCSIGLNLGSEQDGKNVLFERPVLVLRKFNNRTALIVPLTSIIKRTSYHFILSTGSSAILSQSRLVSVKRFQRFVRTISDTELAEVKGRFIDVLYDL